MDLVRVDSDHGLAVVACAVDAGHRDGLEGDVAAGEVLHLGGQTHDVPAVVDGQGAGDGVVELAELAGVGQRLRREDLVRQAGEVGLLAGDPVQVTARQIMTLTHEAQGVRTVEGLLAGREVRTGQGFVDRIVQADVHTADGVGEQHEAEQPDFGVVVDTDAGQVGDGSDKRLATLLDAFLGDLVFVVLLAVGGGFVGLLGLVVVLGAAVDLVQLDVAELRSTIDVGVPGQGDCGGGGSVIGDTDEDHRVRTGGRLLTGPEHVDLLLGKRLALGVRTGVDTDEEDVGRAVGLVAEVESPGGGEAVAELTDRGIAVAAADEQQDGEDAEHGLYRGGAELSVVAGTGRAGPA